MVYGQVKAPVKNDHGAVGAVQLSDRGTALDMPRVPGNGHHVVDGDVLREEVEEVAGPGQPVQALFDDPEERIERGEVRQVGNGCLHDARLLPRRSSLDGEVGEADRRRAGCRENIAVGLGAATACDRLGESAEDLAVLSRDA